MTDEQAMELGRRWMSCKGFKWMPGILWFNANGPGSGRIGWMDVGRDGLQPWPRARDAEPIPDVRDPATLGCLIHRVREVWPSADITIGLDDTIEVDCGSLEYHYFKDGVAALEAAP